MRGRIREDLERRGFRLREPVGNFALLGLIGAAPFALPAAYLDLLRASNGGSGRLRQHGPAVYLTPAEQVMSEHEGWGVDEHAPDQLLFASDGAGGFYLLDDGGRVRFCNSDDVSAPQRWTTVFDRFEDWIDALESAPAIES